MDINKFNGVAGDITPTNDSEHGDYFTFQPKFLPIEIDIDTELARLLQNASLRLGYLNGIGNKELNTTAFLSYSFRRREAVASSNIEGTTSSLKNIVIAEAKKSIEGQKPTGEDLIVANNAAALEEGLGLIATQDFNSELILKLHKILLSGDVKQNLNKPGEFRDGANYIRPIESTTKPILDSPYVPPQAKLIRPYMDNLFSHLNNGIDDASELINVALAHYQFESIHPFWDGNGRIGRLLIILYLIKKKIISIPLLSLSIYFEKERETYCDLLLKTNQEGDYHNWIKFFLQGIINQSDDIIADESKLIAFKDGIEKELLDYGSLGAKSVKVFESLLSEPFTSVPSVKKLLDVSYPTANKAIEKLVELGVIREITGKKSYKVYVAEAMINMVSGIPVQRTVERQGDTVT